MPRILDSLKHEGAHALRSSVWLVSGAALWASAAIFVAAAMAAGLSNVMPLYAAMLCSAALLIVIGFACFLAASRGRAFHAVPRRDQVPVSRPSRIPDLAYQLLEAEIRAQPGKTATAAVVAGLILGALEALEKRGS
jgi:hypothetical protein